MEIVIFMIQSLRIDSVQKLQISICIGIRLKISHEAHLGIFLFKESAFFLVKNSEIEMIKILQYKG